MMKMNALSLISVFCLTTSILGLIIFVPAPVGATDILGLPHAGPVGGFGISSQEGYVLSVKVVGTTNFDLLVLTNESLHQLTINMSYEYVHSLSKFNVTSASIEGELPSGYYNVWIVAHAAGNFTLDYSYGPANLLDNPLALFGILAAIVIVIGLTILYVTVRRRKKE
jgi:hypothetical protein